MHDDSYIGGRSENNIKCVVHDDLGWKNQTTRYILPYHKCFLSYFCMWRQGIKEVLRKIVSLDTGYQQNPNPVILRHRLDLCSNIATTRYITISTYIFTSLGFKQICIWISAGCPQQATSRHIANASDWRHKTFQIVHKLAIRWPYANSFVKWPRHNPGSQKHSNFIAEIQCLITINTDDETRRVEQQSSFYSLSSPQDSPSISSSICNPQGKKHLKSGAGNCLVVRRLYRYT